MKLHPKGEDDMMGDHVVDRGDIKFRPGKGVEINSADDNFQLRIRVRVQMLYTYIHGNPWAQRGGRARRTPQRLPAPSRALRLSGAFLWQAQPVQARDRPASQGQRRPRLLPRLHQEQGHSGSRRAVQDLVEPAARDFVWQPPNGRSLAHQCRVHARPRHGHRHSVAGLPRQEQDAIRARRLDRQRAQQSLVHRLRHGVPSAYRVSPAGHLPRL